MSYFELAKSYLSTQPNMMFSIGSLIADQDLNSIWAIANGVKKDDQQPVSVFIFDKAKQSSQKLALARNALKRTIRYPDCIKFIDGVESDSQIIIGFEQVERLKIHLIRNLDFNLVKLGLCKLASTLQFLSEQFIHGFISVDTVFVTRAGEFKLGNFLKIKAGGFEMLSGIKESSLLQQYGYLFPCSCSILPDFENSSILPTTSIDSFLFGCLIWTIFNGPLKSRDQLESRGSIPIPLFRHSKQLSAATPGSRLEIGKFLKLASAPSGYFDDPFVSTSLTLEQFALKEKEEKDNFLLYIEQSVGTFPIEFCKFKILPELVKSLEFGGAGSKALKPILTIGERLSKLEFDQLVTPAIINLFKSNDRSIRLALCEKIESYAAKLSDSVCNDIIYPNLAAGFNDNTAIIREQTLKAVSTLAPKLHSKTINNSLLRHLAKLQLDSEPGIRTNTAICLARLSKYLDESVKGKVLLQAFLRSLHDPFPPSRKAGLMGLGSTFQCFGAEEICKKILPHVTPLLVDPDKSIRDQAFLTIEIALKLTREFSQNAVTSPAFPIEPVKSAKANDNEKEAGWSGWANAVASGVSSTANVVVSTAANKLVPENHVTNNAPADKSIVYNTPNLPKAASKARTSVTVEKPIAYLKPIPSPTAKVIESNGWDEEWDIPVSPPKLAKEKSDGWNDDGWGDSKDSW